MIQLPYRDIDTGGGGGSVKKRNSRFYKSELEQMTKERNDWRRIAYKGAIALSVIVMGQLFGKYIIQWINPDWMILFAVIIAFASYAWDKWLSLTTQEIEQKRNAAKQERDHRIRMSKLEQ